MMGGMGGVLQLSCNKMQSRELIPATVFWVLPTVCVCGLIDVYVFFAFNKILTCVI